MAKLDRSGCRCWRPPDHGAGRRTNPARWCARRRRPAAAGLPASAPSLRASGRHRRGASRRAGTPRPPRRRCTGRSINPVILSKSCKARSQNNQFSAIGKRHACPVNALIAEPRAFEFSRVKVDHNLFDGRIQKLEINFERQCRGLIEAFDIISNEKPADGEFTVGILSHYRQYINDHSSRSILN